MAKRIGAKRKKAARDIAKAYNKDGTLFRSHKIADARSKRALKRKAYPMT